MPRPWLQHAPSTVLAAAFALVLMARALSAQSPALTPRSAALVVGGYQYDGGKGTIIGLHLDFPAWRVLLVEPSVSYFQTRADDGESRGFIVTEVQAQAQMSAGHRVQPFVGIGAGAAVGFSDGYVDALPALSASGGVRMPIANGWGAQAEVRLHLFLILLSPGELTLGVSHVF